ncbi:diguanylate cyclase [Pseudoalteromonas shioyasakiensis]|uniref:sensor domain-containing diguanylate cyclase n=1 Tax=Pseudoalteromonas shioyasakiensis TaxID=1190813 RepID=UPI00211797D5|nr:diguanylate cyclase [Pseudoalteromonas shioyasakiensis]MCQ8878565.1 diguanylate cyclase [Pseudoalteromonas shioyasakiensis]
MAHSFNDKAFNDEALNNAVQTTKNTWDTLSSLPIAIILLDLTTNTVYCNQNSQTLFNLPNHLSLSSAPLATIQLTDLHTPKTSTLHNLLANADFTEKTFSLANNQLNIKCSQLTPSLNAFIFEPLNNAASADNFDEAIAKISTQLIDIQTDNLDHQIELVLQTIGTFSKADRSYLFQFSRDGKLMSNTHEWVNDKVNPFKERLQNIPQDALPYFYATMKESEVFIVSDLSQLPACAEAERAEFQAEGIQSLLCVGLQADNKLFGFIGCDCVDKARNWTNTDLIRIKLMGEIITRALSNASYKKHIEQIQQQLVKANKELELQANIDSLTSIANRRRFDQTLQYEIKRATRAQQSLSLIICDIDYFKLFNDNYGHQHGDNVLKQVAHTLDEICKRQGDLAARYGGEEFAIILPCIDAVHCKQLSALIQSKIKQLAIPHNYSKISTQLTLSIGGFSCIPTLETKPEQLIQAADKALYKAKNSGRNCIRIT